MLKNILVNIKKVNQKLFIMTKEEAIGIIKANCNCAGSKLREACAMFIPELRESEDERIRKEIWDRLHNKYITLPANDYEGQILLREMAWLEKQGEKAENATKTLAKILKDSAEGFRRILKKKGIDHNVSDNFWEGSAKTYSKAEHIKFIRWMDDLMEHIPIEETPEYKAGFHAGVEAQKQKEQKPKFGDRNLPQLARVKADGHIVNIIDGQLSNDTKNWIMYSSDKKDGYKRYLPEELEFLSDGRPTKWSEEDEILLSQILTILEMRPVANLKELKKFLKSLRPVKQVLDEQEEQKPTLVDKLRSISTPAEENWFEIQKKWEKEDAQKSVEKQDYSGLTDLERVIHRGFLCAGVENIPTIIIKQTAQECLEQMKPAWSEEDEKMLNEIIHDVVELKNAKSINGLKCKVDWLKSLRPSWKPSEEQMKAFKNSIEHIPNAYYDDMWELYEQLKNL